MPNRLEIFNLDMSSLQSSKIPASITQLPLLQHVSVSGVARLDEACVAAFLGELHPPRLRHLAIGDTAVNASWLTSFSEPDHKVFQLVDTLSIPLPDLDDTYLDTIIRLFPSVSDLDLSGSRITGVMIRGLVKGCSRLKVLRLNHCTNIYRDAMKWAREQRIEVVCNIFPA